MSGTGVGRFGQPVQAWHPPASAPAAHAGAATGRGGTDSAVAPPARQGHAAARAGRGGGAGGGRGDGAGAQGSLAQAPHTARGPAAGGALQPVVHWCAGRDGRMAMAVMCAARRKQVPRMRCRRAAAPRRTSPPAVAAATCRRDCVGAGARAPWQLGAPLLVQPRLPLPPRISCWLPSHQGRVGQAPPPMCL